MLSTAAATTQRSNPEPWQLTGKNRHQKIKGERYERALRGHFLFSPSEYPVSTNVITPSGVAHLD